MTRLKADSFEDIEAYDADLNEREVAPDGDDYNDLFGIARTQIASLTKQRDELLVAAKAILNWGRDHTTPTEMNSPHHLLIALKAAIDKIEPPPLKIGEHIWLHDLRTHAAGGQCYIPLHDQDGSIVAFVTADESDDLNAMRFARDIAKLKRRQPNRG